MRSAFFSVVSAGFLALSVNASALAAPLITSYYLGNLSGQGAVSKTHGFGQGASNTAFTDYYTFSINSASNVSGSTTESDAFVKTGWHFKLLDIEVTSLTLLKKQSDGTFQSLVAETAPDVFFFSTLAQGDYRLKIQGTVTQAWSDSPVGTSAGRSGASYTLTASAAPIASGSPEPASLALTGLGLAVVGGWSRRGKPALQPG